MPVGKNSINRVASTTKKSSTTTKKTTTNSAIKVSDTVNAELNSEAVNTTVLTNVSPEVVEKVVGTKKKCKKVLNLWYPLRKKSFHVLIARILFILGKINVINVDRHLIGQKFKL